MTQLIQRIVVGSGLIAIALLWIYLSRFVFLIPLLALVFALFVCIVLWEYYQLAIAKGYQPLDKIGLLTAAGYILALFAAPGYPSASITILLISLIVGFYWIMNFGTSPIINLSVTYFGIAYIALPLGCFVMIFNHFPDSRMWLLYAIAVTKMNDVGAFIGGKFIGKNPMAPKISPKKTVEGVLSGLLFAALTSFAFSFLLDLGLIKSLFLGLFMGLLANFGDAAESLLKRDAGVKDSGVLPGLGGLLDVVDSLVFTLPFLYVYM